MGCAAAGRSRRRPALALAVGEGARTPFGPGARIRAGVGNLSAKERKELRKLAGKLDLKGMGGELLPLRPRRAPRRRRAHSRGRRGAGERRDGRRPRSALHAGAARPRCASCRAPSRCRFFWSLLKMIPAAQAAQRRSGRGRVRHPVSKGLIQDAVHSGDGELGEALRPAVHRLPAQAPRRLSGRACAVEPCCSSGTCAPETRGARLAPSAQLRSLELFGMRFGLDRMRRMMTVLGSPERALRPRSTCSAPTASPRPRG